MITNDDHGGEGFFSCVVSHDYVIYEQPIKGGRALTKKKMTSFMNSPLIDGFKPFVTNENPFGHRSSEPGQYLLWGKMLTRVNSAFGGETIVTPQLP